MSQVGDLFKLLSKRGTLCDLLPYCMSCKLFGLDGNILGAQKAKKVKTYATQQSRYSPLRSMWMETNPTKPKQPFRARHRAGRS